jgi:hypothetical protein
MINVQKSQFKCTTVVHSTQWVLRHSGFCNTVGPSLLIFVSWLQAHLPVRHACIVRMPLNILGLCFPFHPPPKWPDGPILAPDPGDSRGGMIWERRQKAGQCDLINRAMRCTRHCTLIGRRQGPWRNCPCLETGEIPKWRQVVFRAVVIMATHWAGMLNAIHAGAPSAPSAARRRGPAISPGPRTKVQTEATKHTHSPGVAADSLPSLPLFLYGSLDVRLPECSTKCEAFGCSTGGWLTW